MEYKSNFFNELQNLQLQMSDNLQMVCQTNLQAKGS